jgi:hypothetical protein
VKSIKGFVFLPVILIVVLILFVALVVYKGNKEELDKPTIPSETKNLQSNQINLTGMIWTSGLSESEKEVLDIDSNYQIEKSLSREGWDEKTDGMYLISDADDFEKYLGKCVAINGNIYEGWEQLVQNDYEINGKWTYGRSALVVQKVEEKNIDQCVSDYDQTIKDKVTIENSNHETIKGKLEFSKRPAPDIGYDFIIIPSEPFIDEQNSAGYPVVSRFVDVNAGTDEIFTAMTKNTGKEVEVGGYMIWGYAESRYLVVDKFDIL